MCAPKAHGLKLSGSAGHHNSSFLIPNSSFLPGVTLTGMHQTTKD